MSGKLDYIRSELDLERVKYKLKKALKSSQEAKQEKAKQVQERRKKSQAKVTPEITLSTFEVEEKVKPLFSPLLKQRLNGLAALVLVSIIIILAIVIGTTKDKEANDQTEETILSTTTVPKITSTTVQAAVQDFRQCVEYNPNVQIASSKVMYRVTQQSELWNAMF